MSRHWSIFLSRMQMVLSVLGLALLGLAAVGLPMLGLAMLGGCDTAAPTSPTPPGGGQQFVVDEAVYVATVAPVLTNKGCDNVACHGGGLRGSFQLSPADAKDYDYDFAQARLQLNPLDPEASNLLTKPLDPAAGGAVHTAPADPNGFLSKADPGYQAILAWITAGELQ